MKLRKLLAGGLAAVLTVTALPLTAFAADEAPAEEITGEELTADWIPKGFQDAKRFESEYGAVRVKDDLICCVRRGTNEGDEIVPFPHELSEGSELVQIKRYLLELPEEPRQEDFESNNEYHEAYRAYEDACYALGLRPGEDMAFLQKYSYTVAVFRLLPGGSASVRFSENSKRLYTFEADADGKVTETDIFGWLPDCYGEYQTYSAAHPDFDVHDDLITYCGVTSGSTGFVLDIMQEGTAKLECIMAVSCSMFMLNPPVGGRDYFIQVYRPVTAGTVALSTKRHRPWIENDEMTEWENAYFKVEEEGITEITAEEMVRLAGDCNADGAVTVSDLVMLQKWLLCDGELTDWRSADLSGDGKINAVDMALLKRLLMQANSFAEITLIGLPETFPHSTLREITAQAEVRLKEGVKLEAGEELVVMLQNADTNEITVMNEDSTAGDCTRSCKVILDSQELEEIRFVAYAAVRKDGGLAEIRACSPTAVITVEKPRTAGNYN
ncbi:MAG: dockerin type I repeat-containing protein [Oscillospiraceae bacterium]|nr:dockerin type I repeat-containing protein [Oscillospiraceae bacterium]